MGVEIAVVGRLGPSWAGVTAEHVVQNRLKPCARPALGVTPRSGVVALAARRQYMGGVGRAGSAGRAARKVQNRRSVRRGPA